MADDAAESSSVVTPLQGDLSAAAEAAYSRAVETVLEVVSALPDDIRPGPDVYGLPWEPVIVTSLIGLITLMMFSCRCYSSVKSRMYRSKERHMAVKVAELLNEKCKVLETLSRCQHEYDDLEGTLRDSGVLAQTEKTEHLEATHEHLQRSNQDMETDVEHLREQLDRQRDERAQQERRIAELEESMRRTEEETKELQSQEEQAHTSVKVYNMNSERLQRNLNSKAEENTLLTHHNTQLQQQTQGWVERVSELEENIRRCEVSYRGMKQDDAHKDQSLKSLTDRLLKMRALDSSDEEEERGGDEEGGESPRHLHKVQKLIYAAKLNADLKSVDEDKDRVFAKLNDEVRAKEELQDGIKDMEREKSSLQLDSEHYKEQVQRLQQKLQIMTEMYQENELKLHRLLTVEEKERMQKEEKLTKADRNISLALEELHNYRQRAVEMEEELEKTSQSYQTQISAHEKKAHNNWLAARAAERDLTDTRRENALLRQKITDTQFKMDTIGKDPYALDSLARPLPYRGERSPYGPSPLGRPGSDTRPFLSPPTLCEGPPLRLSPRVPRGPLEPPGGHGEAERPHSDSGSISPTWDRDRRGPAPPPLGPPMLGGPPPPGPPGYMYPDGGPMYRRPPPGPPMGPPGPPRGLPPFGPPPHPADRAEPPYLGPGDHEHREPLERRTPPEGLGPPMGPPMGPMDGPFPRRGPYGPPPPDFYPPRGPMGPMMPMRGAPPPHMVFPPRFPPGAGAPPPHFLPSMRPPPPPDAFPPYGPPLSTGGPPLSTGGPPSAPGDPRRPPSPPHGGHAQTSPQHDII